MHFFSDRLGIVAPCGLANGQAKDDFHKDIGVLRNKGLMEIFRSVELVEKSGYGVPKIVREYGMAAFEISDGSVIVKIPFNKEMAVYK